MCSLITYNEITKWFALWVLTGSPSHQSISEWRMQSIARDSEDSTDDEFFDAYGKILIQVLLN